MSGKAEAEGARYICPQCFTAHYLNDVLFAARRPSGACDRRQAAHRYALRPYSAFAQWCGTGETAVLLNWRTLPQSCRQWKEGTIAAVRDLDGSWVTQQACPSCHTPLPPPCPVVIGWEGTRMDNGIVSRLMRSAAETAPDVWKTRRDDTLPLQYDYLLNSSGAVVFGVPAGLEQVKGSSGANYRRRCCGHVSGAVVRLHLRADEDGGLDDIEAIRTLDALLNTFGYSGIALKASAVFLLEGLEDQPDAAALFQKECPQLARLIQYDFEDSLFVAGPCGCDHPQTAVQVLEWLSGRVSRMHMGK